MHPLYTEMLGMMLINKILKKYSRHLFGFIVCCGFCDGMLVLLTPALHDYELASTILANW